MDFAADAVLDIAAPALRGGGKGVRESDAAAFEQQLAAHTDDASRDDPAPAGPGEDRRCEAPKPAPEAAQAPAQTVLGLFGLVQVTAPRTSATAPPSLHQLLGAVTGPLHAPTRAQAAPTNAPAAAAAPVALGASANVPAPPAASETAAQTAAAPPPLTSAAVRAEQATVEPAAPPQPVAAPTPQPNAAAPAPATNVAETAAPEAALAALALAGAPAVANIDTGAKRAPEAPNQQSERGAPATKAALSDAVRAAPTPPAANTKPHAKPAAPNTAPASFAQALAEAAEAPTASSSPSTQAASPLGAATSQHTQAAALEQGAARAQPAATQVAREIVRRFDGGATSFELRLDPPELGRVEVRLEVSRDHRVTATIAADSPQALTELMRHARELEQSLQSAGLELTENGLSFDLRQGGEGQAQEQDGRAGNGVHAGADPDAAAETAPRARPIGLERWRGVRVDVMA